MPADRAARRGLESPNSAKPFLILLIARQPHRWPVVSGLSGCGNPQHYLTQTGRQQPPSPHPELSSTRRVEWKVWLEADQGLWASIRWPGMTQLWTSTGGSLQAAAQPLGNQVVFISPQL